MNCESCGSDHDGEYGSGRFCKAQCARSFATKNKRKEISEKVRETLTGSGKTITIECPVCGKFRTRNWNRRNIITCSRECGNSWRYHPSNPASKKALEEARSAGRKSAAAQRETRRSRNEMHFFELIRNKFPDAVNNEPMFDGWDADVIIPSLKIAIHWDGPWHWRQIGYKQSLKQVQKRDKIKRVKIEACGYTNYTIKDTSGKSLKEKESFVKDKFESFLKDSGL